MPEVSVKASGSAVRKDIKREELEGGDGRGGGTPAPERGKAEQSEGAYQQAELTRPKQEVSEKGAKEQSLPESRWRRATDEDLSRRDCGGDGRKPRIRSGVGGEQTPF